MASRQWSRPVLAAAAALLAALTVAGCVSMPSAGPVQSYPVTQGPTAQAQPYVQINYGPPQPGWSPKEIVEGFLAASASFSDNGQVAREYLTQQASADWNPFNVPVVVYKNGPNVSNVYLPAPAAKPTAKASDTPSAKATPRQRTATVTIKGDVQANLSGNGSYAVASASEPSDLPVFELVNSAGQWRISAAPPQLLLTEDSFANDYQLRNLYFFDPQTRYLVPDPVYVPLQATPARLMDGLVDDLINQPADWLAVGGATRSAFPPGTKRIGDVTLDGVTAVVNLGGAIAGASSSVMQQVSGQLLRTLSGVGQGGQAVQSIEVLQNGKPWPPPHSQDNPVQTQSKYTPAAYAPAAGASGTFYYLGSGGLVFKQSGTQGKPVQVAKIGSGFGQIAVSPDGKYLAALTDTDDLYSGPLGGTLAKRTGTMYTSVSWDTDDDLWATQDGQVVVLLQDNRLLPVSGIGGDLEGVTSLQVAPDGVRVAMISGAELEFGAISWLPGARQDQPNARISFSPFSVLSLYSFQAVTWYGPDNVITLAGPGPTPTVTEYPVNGGNSTQISELSGMESISANSGSALIAGLSDGHMAADASLTGSWLTFGVGGTPVYPG
jgi:Lipoprotein LpqB beta-propeller domain/Sporulation and spore germination